MVDEVAIQKYVGRFSALSALAARALREKAGDVRALFGAAGLFRQAGDLNGALRALDAAIALDAQQASFWFERGQTLRFLGRLQQAAAAYARALDVDPDYYRARYALVQLQPQTAESLSALEAHMEGADEEGWRSLHIGHALAKACEDLGELERSFNWLARAKQRRAGLWAYDAAAEEALVEAALSHAPPAERAPPAGPIFVVGLPRSGTTLVDRIISSHPEVTSAGELANFAILYNMLAGAPMPSVHSAEALRASGVDHTRLGRLYLESARPRCGATPRFVDKAPGNYLLAPHILRALPGARVLCVRRQPMDAVLSNYRQLFASQDRYYAYTYELERAAHKVAQFNLLSAHWREHLPQDRYREVDYDELVRAPEPMTRALIAFCGLSWHDACLRPQENTSPAATPSAAQVRLPINSSSSGRWRAYGALLDPARRVLDEWL